ncbi:hypothetical protein B0H13DRAFT_1941418 [Mycena leptocephala]|nr:hypothetical protein B0H13DRAFT_1941418 [Mycena leptocephala]
MWTAQHAPGNRGDDFRSLKLAELQWHSLMHPDTRTTMLSILGLQGDKNTGKRGMRTGRNGNYLLCIRLLQLSVGPNLRTAMQCNYAKTSSTQS